MAGSGQQGEQHDQPTRGGQDRSSTYADDGDRRAARPTRDRPLLAGCGGTSRRPRGGQPSGPRRCGASWRPAGRDLAARSGPSPRRPGARCRPRAPPAAGPAPCSTAHSGPASCAAARRRRRPTSPGGTGSRDSGPRSTAATNGSPCSVVACVTAPVGRGRRVRVDEVEAACRGQAGEQHRAGRRVDGVPAHVRQPGARQPVTAPGSSPRPLVTTPCSSPDVEEDLHADADAQHRPAGRDPLGDHRAGAERVDPGHAGRVRPDAGHDQPVGRGAPRRGRRSPSRRRRRGPAPARPSAGCPTRSRARPPWSQRPSTGSYSLARRR